MNRGWVAGIAVVVVAAAAGVFVQRMSADRGSLIAEADSSSTHLPGHAAPATQTGSSDSQTSGHHVLGEADPSADSDDADGTPRNRPIPEVLPPVTLIDRAGVPRSLSEWHGRPLVVNFWATWCGPCREEIPLLKMLRAERKADRLEIIGIAIDKAEDVKAFANEVGIDYPVLIGEKDGYAAAESFGVSLVLPFSVFADQKGRIVTLKIGELHADEAAFILDRVRDIDAERLELKAARRQIADKLRDFAVERGKKTARSG